MDPTVTSPRGHLGLPQPPKLSSNPKKRPRPPLPFDQDDDEEPNKESPNTVSHPPRPQTALSNPQFTNSQINHLQRARLRRLMARRAAPPRRACSNLAPKPPSPSPTTTTPTKSTPKICTDQARNLNGRVHPPATSRSSQTTSLWQRLVLSQASIDDLPRVDPRFVSLRRPLDCITGLRASIELTLFTDGYARHDGMNSAPNGFTANAVLANGDSGPAHELANLAKPGAVPTGKPANPTMNAKGVNLAALPRYPYDRASRDFLRAIDLGVIPPPEDLPDPTYCYYYDGCLIAEITDLRDLRPGAAIKYRAESRKKVLLRPDMSSVYSDVANLTRHVDSTVAILVEQKIIAAIAAPLNCDPTPKLACTSQSGNVHINAAAINIARRPKRRRVHRPAGAPVQPNVPTAALLLIGAAEKQQTMMLNSFMGSCVAEDLASNSATTGMSTGLPFATNQSAKSSAEGSATSELQGVRSKNGAAALAKRPMSARPALSKPPGNLFQLHRDKKSQNAAGVANRFGAVATTLHQEHLRIIRFVMPDQNGKLTLDRLRSMERGTSREAPEKIQQMRQMTLANIAKKGAPMYVIELIKFLPRVFQVMVFRGTYGDRHRESFRVPVGSEKEGEQYLTQFQVLVAKEGFEVMQDLKWPQLIRQKQQQQQQQARVLQQRQNAVNSGRQPTVSHAQGNVHNTALQARRAQARSLSQPNLSTNTQQILMQKQKQELHRQHHQRQRQQAQKAPQNGQPNLAALRQGGTQITLQGLGQQISAQSQLSQQQHRSQMTLQQQQQLLQQMQIRQQHSVQRARRMQQQLPGRDKGNVSMAQSAAISASNARGGQLASQGLVGLQGNMSVPQAAGPNSSMGGIGNANLMAQNQVFTSMRQFPQIRNQQQLRTEHPRNVMVGVPGRDAVTGMPGNSGMGGDSAMAQQLRAQTLAGFIDSAAMAPRAGRPMSAPNLSAEALRQQQIQQHLKKDGKWGGPG